MHNVKHLNLLKDIYTAFGIAPAGWGKMNKDAKVIWLTINHRNVKEAIDRWAA